MGAEGETGSLIFLESPEGFSYLNNKISHGTGVHILSGLQEPFSVTAQKNVSRILVGIKAKRGGTGDVKPINAQCTGIHQITLCFVALGETLAEIQRSH